MRHQIIFSSEALRHLEFFDVRDQRIILDALEVQLRHQPAVETKNRKLRRPNPLAPWELRIDEIRIYYNIEVLEMPVVNIIAIGVKRRDRVFILGEEADA